MCRTILALLLLAACGNVNDGVAGDPDATPLPDTPDAPDAAIDAPDAPPPPAPVRAARDIAIAAGRLTGGTFTVDVQLGAIDQSRISGGVFTAFTAQPLNP
jgi:hypothetical protein